LNRVAEVCERVKKQIIPSAKMKDSVESRAEEIRRRVELECAEAGLSAEVRLDGSVAKDTWIRDYVDADIFMRVSTDLTKKQLQDVCLPIAKKALQPNQIVERFAEHPYVESIVKFSDGNLRVNVVPCYRVERGNWLSATDRTPFHTEYVNAHLDPKKRDEVRLLKAFLRGIGAYGADIKTGGFSGMISETLVIALHSFENVLGTFTEWQEARFIDVENYYEERTREVRKVFMEPLVVIDPVDKGRNLGAAVRSKQLWNFVSASRSFLGKPRASFFAEPAPRPLNGKQFEKLIESRGSQLLCVAMGKIDAVVDIVWSQLFRTERALGHLLENHDFEVVRSASWTDENSLSVLLFELVCSELPASRRHRGPPVARLRESSSFLSKHSGKRDTAAGPWIEGDRWYVQKRRSVVSARDLLDSTLRSGGRNVGVAPLLVKEFKRNAQVLEGREIRRLVSSNRAFATYMRAFLAGRPIWLA
jgi:tRNA nucleotidyltransferase (CCA-adding enzyme)